MVNSDYYWYKYGGFHGGTPNWMVYTGRADSNGSPFMETPIWSMSVWKYDQHHGTSQDSPQEKLRQKTLANGSKTNPIKNHKSSKSSNRWCSIHGMTTDDLSKFIVKHWLNHPQKVGKEVPHGFPRLGQLKEGQGQGVVLETRSSWSAAAAAEDEPKKRVSNGGTPKMVGLFCGKSHSRNGW